MEKFENKVGLYKSKKNSWIETLIIIETGSIGTITSTVLHLSTVSKTILCLKYCSDANKRKSEKSQIRISLKLLGLSKNVFTKSFVEFYLVYNRFYLQLPR